MNLLSTFFLVITIITPSLAQTESGNVKTVPDGLLAVGTRVGLLKGTNFRGDSIKIDLNDGKLYLVDFWFYACGPCRQAFPTLARLQETYGDRGFSIVGVNPADKSPEEKARANRYSGYYGLRNNLTEWQIARDFGVDGYPALFLIRNGEVLFTGSGYSIEKMAKVEQRIKTLLK